MKISRILRISRPRFWIYEFGPYLLGITAAWILSKDVSLLLHPQTLAFALFFIIPANIFIYGINDIFDYETDKLNPKKIAYESLVVPQEHPYVWKYVLITTLPFIAFLPFGNTPSVIAFALFLFCALFYSAPPIRAKVIPLLDMTMSAGHYIATAVFGYTLLVATWPPLPVILAGVLWAMAMHAYSAVPDISADTASNINTTATLLGKKATLILCLVFYSASALLAYAYLNFYAIIALVPYATLMIASLQRSEEQLFTLYTYFPKLNSLVGMFLFFYIALSGL